MQTYNIEHSTSNLKSAVDVAFSCMESHDEIVGTVYATPSMVKKLVLALPNDIQFDYIPEGIGIIRTAYLKFMPSDKDSELRFINQEGTIEIKLHLI